MTTERQKYLSGVWRNVGFALLTPLASIIFQKLVFGKSIDFPLFSITVLPFILGWISIAYGYIILEEKKHELSLD